MIESDAVILPTRTGYDRWSEVYDGDGNPLILTGVDFSAGQAARDRILKTNHCTTTTAAVLPNPCVAYDGCDAGFPVHWCEHPAAHTIPSFAAEGIANFFLQF